MKEKKILQFFIGNWDITRTIQSNSKLAYIEKSEKEINKVNEVATGKAKFAKIDNLNIFYREDLEVKYNNANMQAYREYKYSCEYGREIVKYFKEEGQNTYKLFYKLNFTDDYSKAQATYKCEQDLYKATYIFSKPNGFILRYDINGPAKNYIIETIFNRHIRSLA